MTGDGVVVHDVSKCHCDRYYIHSAYWFITTNFNKGLVYVLIPEYTKFDIDNSTHDVINSEHSWVPVSINGKLDSKNIYDTLIY